MNICFLVHCLEAGCCQWVVNSEDLPIEIQKKINEAPFYVSFNYKESEAISFLAKDTNNVPITIHKFLDIYQTYE